MIGINPIPFEAHFTPAVEVGWRLAKKHWGKGYPRLEENHPLRRHVLYRLRNPNARS